MDKEARGGGGGALEEGEKSVETHQRVESGHRDGERDKEGLEGRGGGEEKKSVETKQVQRGHRAGGWGGWGGREDKEVGRGRGYRGQRGAEDKEVGRDRG